MFLNRQNIITKLSSTSSSKINHTAFHQYGLSQLNQNQKRPLRKIKSHSDVLIAKNKKLINFFPLMEHKHNNQSYIIKQTHPKEDHLKLTLGSKKIDKKLTQTNQKQLIQTFRTSYFGGGPEPEPQSKESSSKKKKLQQTLRSNKNETKLSKQRLKKSISMKNIIEQKFLSQIHQSKTKTKNCDSSFDSQKNYDSTKYNWRLSRSKEKSRDKEECFQSTYKLNLSFQKKQIHKNKLHIESNRNTKDSQKTKKYQCDNRQLKQFSKAQGQFLNEKKRNDEEEMKFTFGSDHYYHSIQFS